MQQHEDTLAAYAAQVAADPDTLALVLVGSVARGTERPDSDVDVYLVVGDQAYERAAAAGRVAWVDTQAVTYHGYVDVKLAGPGYLRAAADHADDATRASFLGARVVFDRSGAVVDGIERIVSLPAEVWSGRLHSYRCQARLYGGYFLPQAHRTGDEFLLRHSAVHLCLATGRVALAAHRRFFAGQKYLGSVLPTLPDLPPAFLPAWRAVLQDPAPQTASTLIEVVDRWQGGPLGVDESLSTFITDNELAWLNRTIPPEFW